MAFDVHAFRHLFDSTTIVAMLCRLNSYVFVVEYRTGKFTLLILLRFGCSLYAGQRLRTSVWTSEFRQLYPCPNSNSKQKIQDQDPRPRSKTSVFLLILVPCASPNPSGQFLRSSKIKTKTKMQANNNKNNNNVQQPKSNKQQATSDQKDQATQGATALLSYLTTVQERRFKTYSSDFII
jgi:hypothetical protein